MNRRRFIGLTSLATASLYGSTFISVTSCKKEKGIIPEDSQAIVIGSGFGGSVTALRLAERGIQTLLIEKGKFYDVIKSKHTFSPTLPPDKRSTWLNSQTELPFGPNLGWKGKYVGVLDRVEYQNMNIYRNICLGGGSISNGGVLLEPEENHFKSFISNSVNYTELKTTYFGKVKKMLGASKMPDDLFNSQFYKFSQVSLKHAKNAGFDTIHADSFYNFDIWRQEANSQIQRSALLGELLYGNNNGIKNSLDRNYLADAIGTGNLTIQTLSEVQNIYFDSSAEKYIVDVEQLDESGNSISKQQYISKYLFVCTGSVGTSELLVKSRDNGNLPNLNDEIGKGFGTNGNAFAIRGNINQPTGNMHSSPPTLSILDYNNPFAPLTAMQDIFPLGMDLRILLMVGQPYNEYKGYFYYDKTSKSVQLNWDKNGMEQPKVAMFDFIQRLNAPNGSSLDTLFISDGISSNFTYHPLGGVVLDKASDNFGRVKGYKNLYALDGSMLPGNCALVNPSLTIAALAERNIEKILKEDF